MSDEDRRETRKEKLNLDKQHKSHGKKKPHRHPEPYDKGSRVNVRAMLNQVDEDDDFLDDDFLYWD